MDPALGASDDGNKARHFTGMEHGKGASRERVFGPALDEGFLKLLFDFGEGFARETDAEPRPGGFG